MTESNQRYTSLSAIEYAALQLRVPDSGTKWLDDMIRKARNRDIETQAIAGAIAAGKKIGEASAVAEAVLDELTTRY